MLTKRVVLASSVCAACLALSTGIASANTTITNSTTTQTVSASSTLTIQSGGTLSVTGGTAITMPNASSTVANLGSVSGATGIAITNTGATVTNGSTSATSASIQASSGHAISVASATTSTTISNFGTISSASGTGNGIDITSNTGTSTITNSGTISAGSGDAVQITTNTGAANITNSGTISATSGNGVAVTSSSGATNITNSGTISSTSGNGVAITSTTGATNITNTGTISSSTGHAIAITSATGTTTISNSGTISSGSGNAINVVSSTGDTNITNSGTIKSTSGNAIYIGSGSTLTLTNTGTIKTDSTTNAAVRVLSGGTITNSGTIQGGSSDGTGLAIDHTSGTAALTINNSGTIIGEVKLSESVADTVNFTGGSMTGNITGTGDDVVNFNSGTTTFTGNMTGLASMSVLADATAKLRGNVTATTTTNSGTINVDTQRTITGNYTQNATGKLQVEVGSSDNGSLNVTGTATLVDGADVDVQVDSDTTVNVGNAYTVVSAGTLTVTASELDITDNQPFLNFTASKSGNNLKVTATGASASEAKSSILSTAGVTEAGLKTAAGGGAGGENVGRALTAYTGMMTGLLGSSSNTTEYNAINTAFNTVAAQGGTALANALKDMLPNAPATVGGVSGGGSVGVGVGGAVAFRNDQIKNGNVSGVAAGDNASGIRVWAQPFVGKFDQDTSEGIDGYEVKSRGVFVGADTTLDNALTIGGGFGYGRANIDGKDGSSNNTTDVDTFQLSAYANYNLPSNFFVQGVLGISKNSIDNKRSIDFISRTATSDYDAWQYNVSLKGGKDFKIDQFTLSPAVTFNHTRLYTDSYTETGAGALNLNVDDANTNSTQSGLQLKAAYDIPVEGGTLVPQARIGWSHDFSKASSSTSTLQGGGSAFDTEGREVDNTIMTYGLGVDYKANSDFTVSLQGDYTETDTSDNVSGYLKFNMPF